MAEIIALPTIADAIASLEVAVGIFLLVVRESGSVSSEADAARERLASALGDIQGTRALAAELAVATGRPQLIILEGAAP